MSSRRHHQALSYCRYIPHQSHDTLKQSLTINQGLGATQDAARMQRVVSFYERLPRGPAPEEKPHGLMQRYAARYLGKRVSAARESCTPFNSIDLDDIDMIALAHVIGGLLVLSYAQDYYFHLSKSLAEIDYTV